MANAIFNHVNTRSGNHTITDYNPNYFETNDYIFGIKVKDADKLANYFNSHYANKLDAEQLQTVGVFYANEINTGAITQLSPQFVAEMGPPIDLPAGPHLTNNLSSESFTAGPDYLRDPFNSGIWIDARGTFAFVGKRFNKVLAQQKRVTVLELTKEGNKYRYWQIKNVPANQIHKPNRFFLYRQKLRYRHAMSQKIVEGWFVGLASTLPLKSLLGHDNMMVNWIYSVGNTLTASEWENYQLKKNLELDPFSRYGIPSIFSGNWTRDEWESAAGYQDSDFQPPASTQQIAADAINAGAAKDNSQTALLVKRLKGQKAKKVKEVEALANTNARLATALAKLRPQVEADERLLKEIQERLQNNKSLLAAAEIAKAKTEPQLRREEIRLEKLDRALAAKTAVLKREQEANISAKHSTKYTDNLEKSGMIIDDIGYRRKDSRMGHVTWLRNNPELANSDDWQLCAIKMHTTRPIPMDMGLPEGTKVRASGPHKIKVSVNHEMYPTMTIAPLYPWSLMGNVGPTLIKAYPHTPGFTMKTNNAYTMIDKIMGEDLGANVCLGRLADSASKSFRENNPRMVALAVMSFLRSVNVNDPWGKTFINFPLFSHVKEMTTEEIGSFKDRPKAKKNKKGVIVRTWIRTQNGNHQWLQFCKNARNEQKWFFGEFDPESLTRDQLGNIVGFTALSISSRNYDNYSDNSPTPQNFSWRGRLWNFTPGCRVKLPPANSRTEAGFMIRDRVNPYLSY